MKIGEKYNPYKMFKFSPIPDWVIVRSELSMGAKVVFARLIKYFGANGRCYPKQETLAKEVGLKLRQLKSYVRELKDNRLIAVEQVKQTASEYFLLGHEWMPKELLDSIQSIEIKECSIRSQRVQDTASFGSIRNSTKHNNFVEQFTEGKDLLKEKNQNRLKLLTVYKHELNEKKTLNDFSFMLCSRLKKTKDKVAECLKISDEKKHGEMNCNNAFRLYDDLSYVRGAIGEHDVNKSFSFYWIIVQKLSEEDVKYAKDRLNEAILAGGIENKAKLYTAKLQEIAELKGISLDMKKSPKRGMEKAEPVKRQTRKVA